jgi:hypothetical protein
MTQFVSGSRVLLVGCLAAAGLAVAASPASAFEYVIDFQTSSQHGQIEFDAPSYLAAPPNGLPGAIFGLDILQSAVTTTGSNFVDSGIPQRVESIVPIGHFSNTFGRPNDNQLLSFTNNLNTTPGSSNLDLTWFTEGGFAVTLRDGTIVDLFVKPATGGAHPRPATFDVESFDILGHAIVSPGTAILSVPGPTPAAGSLGLFGLALGAAALKLRQRLAR